MKYTVLLLLLRVLIALRINRVTRLLGRRRVIILCYHGFRADGLPRMGETHEGRHISRSRFRRQLEYLTAQRRVVDLRGALDALQSGESIAEGSVVITVDDGYRSFARIAIPELIEHEAPATLFVSTGVVDGETRFWVDRLEYALEKTSEPAISVSVDNEIENFDLTTPASKATATAYLRQVAKDSGDDARAGLIAEIELETGIVLADEDVVSDHLQVLTWDDIREVSAYDSIGVGSHSVTHPIMTSCTDEVIQHETAHSRNRIIEELGQDCGIFCYPNGAETDFDDRTKTALQRAGYLGALTTVNGPNDQSTDLFELRRHMIDDRASWPEFVARVDGLFDAIVLLWSWCIALIPSRRRKNRNFGVLKTGEG